MPGSGDHEDWRVTAERIRPTILFVVFSLVLVGSTISVALGARRAVIYIVVSLLGLWQAWALAKPGSELRRRVATRFIPFTMFIAAGVAMLVFGFTRLANGQTGRALFAFGGVLFDCVVIGFLVWLMRRAKEASSGPRD